VVPGDGPRVREIDRLGRVGRIGWPVVSAILLFALSVAMFAGWFVP
jgi:hypothetical protein